MRKLALFSLALLPLLACTAILGDFTVGGGNGDGGGDGSPSDVITNPDSPLPDGGGDADAAPPLKLLNCTLNVSRTAFSFEDAGVPVSDGARLMVYAIPNNKYRLLVNDYSGFYYADFYDNQNNATFQRFNLAQNAQILTWTRTPGGTFFLVYENGGLSLVNFADSTQTPVAGLQLVNQGAFAPLMNSSARLFGALDVVNPGTNDFMFMVEYTVTGNPYELRFGHAVGASTSLLPVTNLTTPFEMGNALVHDANHAYLFMSPPGSNGPPTGPSTVYQFDPANPSSFVTHQVSLGNDDGGFYMPFGLSPSQAPPYVDLAIFSADLSQQTVLPILGATRLTAADLMTLDAASIPQVSIPPTLIPVNKSTAHWQTFTNEDEFVAVSRPITDGVPGMNIVWLDSLGRARVLLSTDGGANFPAGLINAADLTFTGTPALAFADFELAWTEGQGNLTSPPIYAARGSCTSF